MERSSFRDSPPAGFGGGPVGHEVGATVKWFKADKGFGFAELSDGSGDAFLHISVLQRAGAEAVNPGASLRVRVGPGPKGQQVTEVLEVRDAEPPPPRADRSAPYGGGMGGGMAEAQELRGTVKWYNPEKGFGFITPETGGKDVFVHATALERGGMQPLAEGQVVMMRVVQGKKGPEAASVSNG
jgi:CspA family cold shock protein